MSELATNHLGKVTTYKDQYDASLLEPIPRILGRKQIGIASELPFSGFDYWTAFEVSWIDRKGKPYVAIAQLKVPCHSQNLVESKSLKLYFNSFNQTAFDNISQVENTILEDLSNATGELVDVCLIEPQDFASQTIIQPKGTCIDDFEVEATDYEVNPDLLKTNPVEAYQCLYSNLLKTNCPVTGQPDWATVVVDYKGEQIDYKSLLKYIISYRKHTGFHEQCVENIFYDIMKHCQPQKLTVHAHFTRRGGIDINPFRSNFQEQPESLMRFVRQ